MPEYLYYKHFSLLDGKVEAEVYVTERPNPAWPYIANVITTDHVHNETMVNRFSSFDKERVLKTAEEGAALVPTWVKEDDDG